MLQAAHASHVSTEKVLSYNPLGQLIIGNFRKPANRNPHEKAPKKDTDIDIVKSFQSGNLKAFDLLVIKYQSNVARVVSMYISDFDAVKDVTQEAFIRAYKGLHNFRLDSQFYTWLYRIAVNSAYGFLKTNKRYQNNVDVDDVSNQHEIAELTQTEGPEKIAQNDDLRTAINRSVACLPIALRTALLLREKEGLSYEQIAIVVGCREGTVKSRISRAREQVVKATEHLYR